MSELELVVGKQVERADFASADNRSVRPPSLSEVGRSQRGNLRKLAFSGFHGSPPKILSGRKTWSVIETALPRLFELRSFSLVGIALVPPKG